MMHDLMILCYDHYSPDADNLEEMNRKIVSLRELYSTPLSKLPTLPERANMDSFLLTTETENVGLPIKQPKFVRRLKNPIDYTAIPSAIFNAPPPLPERAPYSPFPARLPGLKKIKLSAWADEAASNKNIVLASIMLLQSITGVRPDPLLAEKGDSNRRIRPGMPMGSKLELQGRDMYLFLDKLVQCVLPRISDFEAINPVGDGKGSLTFVIPSGAMGYFPDVEPHFEMFPRMFDTKITLYTSGRNDWETCLLLSGFKLPFKKERYVEEETESVEDDPWAKVRAAKTKEERKELAALLVKKRK